MKVRPTVGHGVKGFHVKKFVLCRYKAMSSVHLLIKISSWRANCISYIVKSKLWAMKYEVLITVKCSSSSAGNWLHFITQLPPLIIVAHGLKVGHTPSCTSCVRQWEIIVVFTVCVLQLCWPLTYCHFCPVFQRCVFICLSLVSNHTPYETKSVWQENGYYF